MKQNNRLIEFDGAKFFLILGVILIHSNIGLFLPKAMCDNFAVKLMDFNSNEICGACVPLFFLLSGFLMFHNVHKLTPEIYIRKLKSRLHTLLIPYLIWNIVSAIFFIVKSKYLGFNDFGIWGNGGFNVALFLRGFWNLFNGYPFEFTFWFIRNLIIFVMLSPVSYFVARNRYLMILVTIAVIIFDNTAYGFFYFTVGVWLAYRPKILNTLNCNKYGTIGMSMWLALSLINHINPYEQLSGLLTITKNLGAFPAFLMFGRAFVAKPTTFHKFLISSTFFIYAFHGLYATVIRKAILSLTGSQTTLELLSAYAASFLFLFSSSLLAYWIMSGLMPQVTGILCGGRDSTSGIQSEELCKQICQ